MGQATSSWTTINHYHFCITPVFYFLTCEVSKVGFVMPVCDLLIKYGLDNRFLISCRVYKDELIKYCEMKQTNLRKF